MVDLHDIILAGVLQGILEWFPVSSSGQVMLLLSGLFGLEVVRAYGLSIYFHLGTLLSAIVFYRRDLAGIPRVLFTRTGFWENSVLRLWIITTPISIALGYPLYMVYTMFLEGVTLDVVTGVIGLLLVATGIALAITGSKQGFRSFKDMVLRDYFLLGLAQGLSIIPGISRSGSTIAVLLLLGFKASESIRISFLASIPVIALATLYVGYTSGYVFSPTMFLGLISAFIFGLLGIWFMNILARKIPFYYFAITIGLIMALASIPLLFL